MEKSDYSIYKLVHEEIINFISKAKSERMLADAVTYLAVLASRGNDRDFELSDEDISDKLKKYGRSFGFVYDTDKVEGQVTGLMQRDLNKFFSDKSNLSLILENEREPNTRKRIEKLFNKSGKNVDSADFSGDESAGLLSDADRERENFYKKAMEDKLSRFILVKGQMSPIAVKYLASLAISGEIVPEVVGMPVDKNKVRGISPSNPYLKNTELIDKLNRKAQEMGIVSVNRDYVSASMEMREHLTNFLLGDAMNRIKHFDDYGRTVYDDVRKQLNDLQGRRSNFRS